MDDYFHPAVPFAWCAAVILAAMLAMHPVYIAAGLVCATAVGGLTGGIRPMLRFLPAAVPMLALIAFINMVASPGGVTPLFRIGSMLFTAEALTYGLCAGGMLLLVVGWFAVYSRLVPPEKFLYLFSRAAPAAALLVTMTQRMIPLFARRARAVAAAQKTLLSDMSQGSPAARFRSGLRISSILMSWSLEDGLDTADSMKARGYGSGRRSFFVRWRFKPADAFALALILACFLAVVTGYYAGAGFHFYPTLGGTFRPGGIVSLAADILLALLPFIGRLTASRGIFWQKGAREPVWHSSK